MYRIVRSTRFAKGGSGRTVQGVYLSRVALRRINNFTGVHYETELSDSTGVCRVALRGHDCQFTDFTELFQFLSSIGIDGQSEPGKQYQGKRSRHFVEVAKG